MKIDYYRILSNIYANKAKKNAEKEIEKRRSNNTKNFVSVSSMGSCLKKQQYLFNQEKPFLDGQLLLKARFGTILHKDIEDEIEKEDIPKAIAIYKEIHLIDEEKGISGHPDLVIEYESCFDLVDFKFVHDYVYRKNFGQKKNRDPNASETYKMSVSLYAYMMEKILKKEVRSVQIIFFKKSDSKGKPLFLNREEIVEYQQKSFEYIDMVNESRNMEMERHITFGAPFQSWECNYCNFRKVCR